MPVIKNVSREYRDVDKIVSDLLLGVDDSWNEDCFAFILCDDMIDYPNVIKALYRRGGFHMGGGTTDAFPEISRGDQVSATLTLIKREGMKVRRSVSEALALEDDQYKYALKRAYDRCIRRMGDDVKAIVHFIPRAMSNLDILASIEINRLGNADGIPVFTGTTIDYGMATGRSIFVDDTLIEGRVVLTAIGGDVRPVFASGSDFHYSSVTHTNSKLTVTRAEGVNIQEINGIPALDYFIERGFLLHNDLERVTDNVLNYEAVPLALAKENPRLPFLHGFAIKSINLKHRSITASTQIEVGDRIFVGDTCENSIRQSTVEAMGRLKARMQQVQDDHYQYEAILCMSDCSRYYFSVASQYDMEATLLQRELGTQCALAGIYTINQGTAIWQDDSFLNIEMAGGITLLAL